MAHTPKPVRKEIKKHESFHRGRIKKLEKTNEVAPKGIRKADLKDKGVKRHKQETKYMIEETMKNKKERAGMKKMKSAFKG